MKTIGVIGCGHMGSAIVRGLLDAAYVKPAQLMACDQNSRVLRELEQEHPGVTGTEDALDVAARCDMIILAVKPYVMAEVIQSIRPALNGKAVVSIAAGWTMARLSEALEGSGAACLRVMPNTPAMVGEGMTAVCAEHTLSPEDFEFARGIFDAMGRTAVLHEAQFDGATAISGSSPAYVYMFIEAMADAGVREGLPRPTAYEMAAQAVLGSALMVLTTGEHPGALKDAVCSPGGTTIEAVAELERMGFRAAVLDAMAACARKSREMADDH